MQPILMLIDDDADDHETFTAALQVVCPEAVCKCFFSAAEALTAIQEHGTTSSAADLILVDISMPEINGFQFIEKLRSLKVPTIPIILISTTVSFHRSMVEQLGVRAFNKPHNDQETVALLRSFPELSCK